MNVGEIKSLAAAYLQKEVSFFVQNGVDMLLLELNAARRNAEMLHDFAHNKATWELLVDPDTGGKIDDATIVDPETWQTDATIKAVETFYLLSNDGLSMTPLYHVDKKNTAVWMKERNRRWRYTQPAYRYADDKVVMRPNPPFSVSLNGRLVEMQPKPESAVTLRIDGQLWMPEYIADEDSDWMTQFGADYLKFAVICACNDFTQTFVASQESRGAPTRERDSALASLVAWDDDWMMNGRQIKAMRN